MKGTWKILIGVTALGVAGGIFLLRAGHGARIAVEQTRLAFREQGFKTDLGDFSYNITEQMSERVAALGLENRVGQSGKIAVLNNADLMTPASEHSAVVIWKEAKLVNPSGLTQFAGNYNRDTTTDVWPLLREQLEEERLQLNNTAAAVLAGPLRYPVNIGQGGPVMLSHLMGIRRLTEKFSSRAMMALHDNDRNAAWTNLLVATRLLTEWDMEPVEISHHVRCYCLEMVYNVTWQVLQAGDWPEERLYELQREWESLELLKRLPETVACMGAGDVAALRAERARPLAKALVSNPITSPRRAYDDLVENWRERRYRATGTYVDEKAMLEFYHERELEMLRAVECTTWAEMSKLPVVVSNAIFQSPYKARASVAGAVRQTRQIALSFQGRGNGLIERAAEGEARRRVIVAAIALERFHGRHGAYPKTLAELAPEFVKTVPMDFMDGKPLRYTTTKDGHFVLYSVGLEGVDKGGKLRVLRDAREMALQQQRGGSVQPGGELVWPSPE